MLLSLLTSLFLAPTSFAAPPADALAMLQQSYVPGSQASETSAGHSFNLCALTDLKLAVVDPIDKGAATIQARIYQSTGSQDPKTLRTVILLPPTGGENLLDQVYSNYLCSSGFRVILLQTWSHQTDMKLDIVMHDEGAIRSTAAIRHVLDYLAPQRSTQVGIIGTSVGALSSALALGFDSRLNTGVLIVGGTGEADIIARSNEQGVAQLRDARMKAFGYKDIEEYAAAVKQKVRIDPADFVNYTGPKNILAFVGTEDITVPTANQRELVQMFHAQSVEYAGDHVATIKHTALWDRATIADYFNKNLK